MSNRQKRMRYQNPTFNKTYNLDSEDKKIDLGDENEIAIESEVVDKVEDVKNIINDIHTNEKVSGKTLVLCNVRESPNMDSNVLAVLQPETDIFIYKDDINNFYKIKYLDINGYIRKDLCSF